MDKLIPIDAAAMNASLSAIDLTIVGPRWGTDGNEVSLWEAQARLLSYSTAGAEFRAARNVFMAKTPRDLIPGSEVTHLPGTMLVRCRVSRVTIKFGNDVDNGNQGSLDVTLLIRARPDLWKIVNPSVPNARIERVVCIAGDFSLQPFFGNVLPPPLKKALQKNNARIFDSVTNLRAASSGLILDAVAHMPDLSEGAINPIDKPAPYLVEVFLPPIDVAKGEAPHPDGTLHIRPDRERMSQFRDGESQLLNYFSGLVARLNPASADGSLKKRMRWLRLELTDPTRVPDFFWRASPANPQRPLGFDPGEWKLLLSDQRLRDPNVFPRGVLTGTPNVTIGPTALIAESGLAPAGPNTPVAEYTSSATNGEWNEDIALRGVRFGYDAVLAASRLRDIYHLPIPRPDDIDEPTSADFLAGTSARQVSDGKIDPPVIWGFSPLQDGWAQLPFFNMTEQMFVDALPSIASASSVTASRITQLQGGALFGIDRPELESTKDAEMPWNLALLDAEHYKGTWTFAISTDGTKPLQSVGLTFSNPVATIEGMFWLASSPPSAVDAIPSLDNWLAGLESLPLRTPRAGDSYPSPFELFATELRFSHEVQERTADSLSRARLDKVAWTYQLNSHVHEGTAQLRELFSPEKISSLQISHPGINPDDAVTTKLPLHVWLTSLPRSRFPAHRFWNETADKPGIAQHVGLAWRRHPEHPCIQALPLTQSAVPPNYPSASRQLAPFALPVAQKKHTLEVTVNNVSIKEDKFYFSPEKWSMTLQPRQAPATAANEWPTITTAGPTPEWGGNGLRGLAIIPLGLPGAALEPWARPQQNGIEVNVPDPSDFVKQLQYRHDLPYLDQPNALAEVPKDRTEASAPQPAMLRGDYVKLWRTLDDRALLASADAVDALTSKGAVAPSSPVPVAVDHLMEPLKWNATLTTEMNAYPGSMHFVDSADASKTIELNGESFDALRGFDGGFNANGSLKLVDTELDPANWKKTPIRIVGGSFSAIVQTVDSANRLRDQRGLLRGAAAPLGDTLEVPIRIESTATDGGTVDSYLLSATKLTDLKLDGITWQFWFVGLPVEKSSNNFLFDRAKTVSDNRRGVNDPAALDRQHGFRSAYQWRLGHSTNQADPEQRFLPIGPFRFYPLSLEKAELTDQGAVVKLQVLGRLQLSLWDSAQQPQDAEFVNVDSAVVIEFLDGKLNSIVRAPPDPDPNDAPAALAPLGCWPLSNADQNPGGPAILWKTLTLTSDKKSLIVKDWRLAYTRHGVVWDFRAKSDLTIALGPAPSDSLFDQFDLPAFETAGIKQVKLELLFSLKRYVADIQWSFGWGDATKLRLVAIVTDHLLFDPQTGNLRAYLEHTPENSASPPIHLKLSKSNRVDLDTNAVQFIWEGLIISEEPPAGSALVARYQILPGMHLEEKESACHGFGMLTFQIVERLNTQTGTRSNEIQVRGAYFDAIFSCNWGKSLQEAASGIAKRDPAAALTDDEVKDLTEAAFGSSSGIVTAEYVCQARFDGSKLAWDANLSLWGLVEIKNLLTWPKEWKVTSQNQIQIPAARLATKPDLHHWRHSARFLLAEHQPPKEVLAGGETAECFLQIATDKVWNLAAVVEHQLVAVTVKHQAADVQAVSLASDTRWTTSQQVRLCSASATFKHLLALNADRKTTDPLLDNQAWTIRGQQDVNHGWYSRVMRSALGIPATPPSTPAEEQEAFERSEFGQLVGSGTNRVCAMIVEASLPQFLRGTPAKSMSGTDLFPIPRGAVHAGLASLGDFWAVGATELQWLFAEIPLIGRMQPADRNGAAPLLVADPVVAIARDRSDQPTRPIRALLQGLANWSDNTLVKLDTTAFDRPNLRFFGRLDASSLAEGWFRLVQLQSAIAPAADLDTSPLAGILTAAPSDTASTLARPAPLARLFDPRRASLPPRVLLPETKLPQEIEWTPDSLLVQQTALRQPLSNTAPFAFVGFPLALYGSGFLRSDEPPANQKTIRHPAATMIPAVAGKILDRSTFQPVTLALSPFLSLEQRIHVTSNSQPAPLMAGGELVAFDAAGNKAKVVASQVSHKTSATEIDNDFLDWGVTTHARQASDSPCAIIRVRQLDRVDNEVVVQFRFLLPLIEQVRPQPSKRAIAVRAIPERLRHAQGQFMGTLLPEKLEAVNDFELAPPLTRGAMPFRLNNRPKPLPVGATQWPWGVAGLRLATAYRQTNSQKSLAGTAGERLDTVPDQGMAHIWWQALSQPVQFANPETRRLLPKNFRVSALPGYLPAWPKAPLPDVTDLVALVSPFQPVLPGGRRVLMTGLRPGVLFAFREFLLTQRLKKAPAQWSADVITSCTVPVQHRAPRPILVPKNRDHFYDVALQSWGSPFDLIDLATGVQGETVGASDVPVANGFSVAQFARGIATFETNPGNPSVLPKGTVISWKENPQQDPLTFQTTQNYTLNPPSAVEVDVIALKAGAASNVVANSVFQLAQSNSAIKSIANRLPFAGGTDAPGEGPEISVSATPPGPATATVKFTIANVANAVTIPIGTRVGTTASPTDQGAVNFLTLEEAVGNPGQSVDVGVVAERVGLDGYVAPNTIKFVHNTLPGVASVNNDARSTFPNFGSAATPATWEQWQGRLWISVRMRFRGSPEPQHPEHLSKAAKWLPANSTVKVSLHGQDFRYSIPDLSTMQHFAFDVKPNSAADLDRLKTAFNASNSGDKLLVVLSILHENTNPDSVRGYRETLEFSLRVNRDNSASSRIYAPRYLSFEDPEYNRQLASLTARATKLIKVDNGPPPILRTIAFSADRREYNTTGMIHYAFACETSPVSLNITGTVEILRRDKEGNDHTLEPDVPLKERSLPSDPKFMDLAQIGKGKLIPGDSLILRLKLVSVPEPANSIIDLVVSIVALPVTPVPEAGYALLRRTKQGAARVTDECPRFAWGPDPARIELINPDDLLGQVVRRRAIFTWFDSVRNRADYSYSYAIQKVTIQGATHFPVPK